MDWGNGGGDVDDEGDWAARYDEDVVPSNGDYKRDDGGDEELVDHEDTIANKPAHEPQPAVLGDQCPICLHALEDAVMIQGCFHVYCYSCITNWVRNLALHGVRTPTCPLCKRIFTSAYADVMSETEYQVVRFDGSGSGRKQLNPQADALLRRSMIYRKRMRIVRVNGVDVSDFTLETAPRPVKTLKREYGQWMERELRACIGPDIDLTVFVALIESVLGSPVKKTVSWKELEATLEPFLLDDTSIFVRELSLFLSSRLNMHAYDNAVEYCCSSGSQSCSIESCCGNTV